MMTRQFKRPGKENRTSTRLKNTTQGLGLKNSKSLARSSGGKGEIGSGFRAYEAGSGVFK